MPIKPAAPVTNTFIAHFPDPKFRAVLSHSLASWRIARPHFSIGRTCVASYNFSFVRQGQCHDCSIPCCGSSPCPS